MTETKPESSGVRELNFGPLLKTFTSTLAIVLTLGSLAWAADLFRMVGLLFFNEQHLALALAIALPLLFLVVPARKGPRASVPWYDWIAAALGFAASMYIFFRYPDLMDRVIENPLDGLIVSAVMIALCLEGLRRTVGWTLVMVTVFLFGYAMIGHLVPGVMQTQAVSAKKLIVYLGLDTSALLGIPMLIVATIVVGFVFFGQVLQKSGGGEFFNDLALALMGRFRGGSAKISITASSLFGSISGIVVSNIMATGVMTIPMMKRAGYPAHSAAAIEAVASTGGQLMPPVMGAVAFFMAERLQVPYSSVAMAALIPAVLYYMALFIQADLEAAREGIQAEKPEDIPSLWSVLKGGWMLTAPFVVIVVALFPIGLPNVPILPGLLGPVWDFVVGSVQPQQAALYGSLTAVAAGLLFGYKGRRMSLRDTLDAVIATGRGVLDIFMIAAAAGFIIGIMHRTGLGFGLTIMLVNVGSTHILLLLLIAAILCIVFGMGLPTLAVYLLLSILVAPSLVEAGLDPMGAHMFIFYFGMMSMITPPLAIAAFFAASLAQADAMKTGFAAMRFGWPAYVVPFLFIASPALLMRGGVVEIAYVFLASCGGIWLISVGMSRFLYRRLGLAQQLAFLASGTLLMIPWGAVSWAPWANAAGLVLAMVVVGGEWKLARMETQATTG